MLAREPKESNELHSTGWLGLQFIIDTHTHPQNHGQEATRKKRKTDEVASRRHTVHKVPVCVCVWRNLANRAGSGYDQRIWFAPKGRTMTLVRVLGQRKTKTWRTKMPCAQVAAMLKTGQWDVSPHHVVDHNPLNGEDWRARRWSQVQWE